MNLIKKLISIILISILILVQFLPIVNAIDDTTPPNIISISSDNTSLSVGDTVFFNIEIEDDFSGPSILYIQWKLKTDETKSIDKTFYNVNDTQQLDYVIPENTNEGEWIAVYISISDYANNSKFYERVADEELLSKLDFEVKDSNQDTTPPVVSNVRMVTQDFTAPCDVIIEYDVTDDNSGVKDHFGGATYSPSNDLSSEGTGSCKKVSGNTYRSIFSVKSKFTKYIFRYISVCDNAGNWKNYTYEDLELTDELDIIPSNYEEDTIAPKMTSIEYNKTKLNIPDSLELLINVEENESGIEQRGLACFKCEDASIKGNKYIAPDYKSYYVDDPGDSPEPENSYLFISNITSATDNQGYISDNKLKARLEFNYLDEFRGNIYLDKLIIWDKAGNKSVYSIADNSLSKETITISKIEKEYTLKTSTAKTNYINEIAELPEGSTVLCNVLISNQIIEKELFDAIKGKDITITFMSIYNGSSNVTGADSYTSSDTNTGIQWIINGKDIVNETKDIDMKVKFSKKIYSKFILPEYEFNEKLEDDYWANADWENSTEEEILKGFHELQIAEIEKYFSYMKEQGYLNTDEYLEKTINELQYVESTVKGLIISANEHTDYLSIEFANNGVLPCKTLVRIKPEYATRAIFGANDLSLYYSDGNNYSLVEKDIKLDEENYYNFNVTHNSEYWLANGNFEKLAKGENSSNNESQDNQTSTETNKDTLKNNPKTGDNIKMWISLMLISMFGILGMVILLKKRK